MPCHLLKACNEWKWLGLRKDDLHRDSQARLRTLARNEVTRLLNERLADEMAQFSVGAGLRQVNVTALQ